VESSVSNFSWWNIRSFRERKKGKLILISYTHNVEARWFAVWFLSLLFVRSWEWDQPCGDRLKWNHFVFKLRFLLQLGVLSLQPPPVCCPRDTAETLYLGMGPVSSNLQLSRECKSKIIARKINKAVYSVLNEERNKYRCTVSAEYSHCGVFGLQLDEGILHKRLSDLRKCCSNMNTHFQCIQWYEEKIAITSEIHYSLLHYSVSGCTLCDSLFFSLWTALLLLAWQQALLSLSTAIKSLTCVSCAVLLLGDKVGVSQLRALVFQAPLSRAFCCDEASQMTRKTYSHVKYPCLLETSEGKWKGF